MSSGWGEEADDWHRPSSPITAWTWRKYPPLSGGSVIGKAGACCIFLTARGAKGQAFPFLRRREVSGNPFVSRCCQLELCVKAVFSWAHATSVSLIKRRMHYEQIINFWQKWRPEESDMRIQTQVMSERSKAEGSSNVRHCWECLIWELLIYQRSKQICFSLIAK